MRRLTALVMLFLFLLAPAALAKSWSIDRAEIQITLNEKGDMAVTEKRTFAFDGAFHHIYQVVLLPERSAMENVALAGPEGPYKRSDSKEPGTYQVTGDQIDWYFQAADSLQTFTLSYTVTHAIRMHEDSAELYWQVIGTEWEADTSEAAITIQLPGNALEARVEGGTATLNPRGNMISVSANGLPAGQGLAVRVFLPKEAVAGSTLPSDGKTLEEALQEGLPSPYSTPIVLGWTALALIAAAYFWRRYVQRPRFQPEELGAPAPLSPVQVAWLTGQNAETALRTAVLDLTLSGALQVEAAGDRDWRYTRIPMVPVPPESRGALRVLFPNGEGTITLSQWQQIADQNTYSTLTRWFNDLRKSLPAEWFRPHTWWGYALAATVLPLFAFIDMDGLVLLPIVGAVVLVLVSAGQRSFSDDGERARQAWLNQKGTLHESTEQLAMAVALGLAIRGLSDPSAEFGQQYLWFHHTSDTFHNRYHDWTSSSSGGGGDGGGGGADGGGGGGAE